MKRSFRYLARVTYGLNDSLPSRTSSNKSCQIVFDKFRWESTLSLTIRALWESVEQKYTAAADRVVVVEILLME